MTQPVSLSLTGGTFLAAVGAFRPLILETTAGTIETRFYPPGGPDGLGTPDARIHFHAGMISYARGDNASARQHLTLALEINPHFSLLHASEARATLAALGK